MININEAEWLLLHYHEHIAEAKLLELEIRQLQEWYPTDEEIDSMVLSLSLRSSAFDDIHVRSSNESSPTERIAENYMDLLMKQVKAKIHDKSHRLAQLNAYIQACDALLELLSPEEKLLITDKYMNKKAYTRIIDMLPQDSTIRSKSGLSKKCRQILNRMNVILQKSSLRIPKP